MNANRNGGGGDRPQRTAIHVGLNRLPANGLQHLAPPFQHNRCIGLRELQALLAPHPQHGGNRHAREFAIGRPLDHFNLHNHPVRINPGNPGITGRINPTTQLDRARKPRHLDRFRVYRLHLIQSLAGPKQFHHGGTADNFARFESILRAPKCHRGFGNASIQDSPSILNRDLDGHPGNFLLIPDYILYGIPNSQSQNDRDQLGPPVIEKAIHELGFPSWHDSLSLPWTELRF